jgi:hypothetical protein
VEERLTDAKVKHGVMFDVKEKEGMKRRHQVRVAGCLSMLAENSVRWTPLWKECKSRSHSKQHRRFDVTFSGLNRITKNLQLGLAIIDESFRFVFPCVFPQIAYVLIST